MENERVAMKVASLLLQYPDELLRNMIEEIRDRVEGAAGDDFRNACRDLMNFLKANPLVRLQEAYTRAFDLSADTSLHLTYHKWGEGEERAEGLLRLKQAYREAGYEVLSGELPDFLPLVLEFFSIAPERLIQTIWHEYGLQVGKIAGVLEGKGSPYGRLVRALYHMLEAKGSAQGG
jgi:nitrate reductase molybdenum cofactor assembly chaperone NarJ/NarW